MRLRPRPHIYERDLSHSGSIGGLIRIKSDEAQRIAANVAKLRELVGLLGKALSAVLGTLFCGHHQRFLASRGSRSRYFNNEGFKVLLWRVDYWLIWQLF